MSTLCSAGVSSGALTNGSSGGVVVAGIVGGGTIGVGVAVGMMASTGAVVNGMPLHLRAGGPRVDAGIVGGTLCSLPGSARTGAKGLKLLAMVVRASVAADVATRKG